MDELQFDFCYQCVLNKEEFKREVQDLQRRFLTYKKKVIDTNKLIQEYNKVKSENEELAPKLRSFHEEADHCRTRLIQYRKTQIPLEEACKEQKEKIEHLSKEIKNERDTRLGAEQHAQQLIQLLENRNNELKLLEQRVVDQKEKSISLKKEITAARTKNAQLNSKRLKALCDVILLGKLLNKLQLLPKQYTKWLKKWQNEVQASGITVECEAERPDRIFSPDAVCSISSQDTGFDSMNSNSDEDDQSVIFDSGKSDQGPLKSSQPSDGLRKKRSLHRYSRSKQNLNKSEEISLGERSETSIHCLFDDTFIKESDNHAPVCGNLILERNEENVSSKVTDTAKEVKHSIIKQEKSSTQNFTEELSPPLLTQKSENTSYVQDNSLCEESCPKPISSELNCSDNLENLCNVYSDSPSALQISQSSLNKTIITYSKQNNLKKCSSLKTVQSCSIFDPDSRNVLTDEKFRVQQISVSSVSTQTVKSDLDILCESRDTNSHCKCQSFINKSPFLIKTDVGIIGAAAQETPFSVPGLQSLLPTEVKPLTLEDILQDCLFTVPTLLSPLSSPISCEDDSFHGEEMETTNNTCDASTLTTMETSNIAVGPEWAMPSSCSVQVQTNSQISTVKVQTDEPTLTVEPEIVVQNNMLKDDPVTLDMMQSAKPLHQSTDSTIPVNTLEKNICAFENVAIQESVDNYLNCNVSSSTPLVPSAGNIDNVGNEIKTKEFDKSMVVQVEKDIASLAMQIETTESGMVRFNYKPGKTSRDEELWKWQCLALHLSSHKHNTCDNTNSRDKFVKNDKKFDVESQFSSTTDENSSEGSVDVAFPDRNWKVPMALPGSYVLQTSIVDSPVNNSSHKQGIGMTWPQNSNSNVNFHIPHASTSLCSNNDWVVTKPAPSHFTSNGWTVTSTLNHSRVKKRRVRSNCSAKDNLQNYPISSQSGRKRYKLEKTKPYKQIPFVFLKPDKDTACVKKDSLCREHHHKTSPNHSVCGHGITSMPIGNFNQVYRTCPIDCNRLEFPNTSIVGNPQQLSCVSESVLNNKCAFGIYNTDTRLCSNSVNSKHIKNLHRTKVKKNRIKNSSSKNFDQGTSLASSSFNSPGLINVSMPATKDQFLVKSQSGDFIIIPAKKSKCNVKKEISLKRLRRHQIAHKRKLDLRIGNRHKVTVRTKKRNQTYFTHVVKSDSDFKIVNDAPTMDSAIILHKSVSDKMQNCRVIKPTSDSSENILKSHLNPVIAELNENDNASNVDMKNQKDLLKYSFDSNIAHLNSCQESDICIKGESRSSNEANIIENDMTHKVDFEKLIPLNKNESSMFINHNSNQSTRSLFREDSLYLSRVDPQKLTQEPNEQFANRDGAPKYSFDNANVVHKSPSKKEGFSSVHLTEDLRSSFPDVNKMPELNILPYVALDSDISILGSEDQMRRNLPSNKRENDEQIVESISYAVSSSLGLSSKSDQNIHKVDGISQPVIECKAGENDIYGHSNDMEKILFGSDSESEKTDVSVTETDCINLSAGQKRMIHSSDGNENPSKKKVKSVKEEKVVIVEKSDLETVDSKIAFGSEVLRTHSNPIILQKSVKSLEEVSSTIPEKNSELHSISVVSRGKLRIAHEPKLFTSKKKPSLPSTDDRDSNCHKGKDAFDGEVDSCKRVKNPQSLSEKVSSVNIVERILKSEFKNNDECKKESKFSESLLQDNVHIVPTAPLTKSVDDHQNEEEINSPYECKQDSHATIKCIRSAAKKVSKLEKMRNSLTKARTRSRIVANFVDKPKCPSRLESSDEKVIVKDETLRLKTYERRIKSSQNNKILSPPRTKVAMPLANLQPKDNKLEGNENKIGILNVIPKAEETVVIDTKLPSILHKSSSSCELDVEVPAKISQNIKILSPPRTNKAMPLANLQPKDNKLEENENKIGILNVIPKAEENVVIDTKLSSILHKSTSSCELDVKVSAKTSQNIKILSPPRTKKAMPLANLQPKDNKLEENEKKIGILNVIPKAEESVVTHTKLPSILHKPTSSSCELDVKVPAKIRTLRSDSNCVEVNYQENTTVFPNKSNEIEGPSTKSDLCPGSVTLSPQSDPTPQSPVHSQFSSTSSVKTSLQKPILPLSPVYSTTYREEPLSSPTAIGVQNNAICIDTNINNAFSSETLTLTKKETDDFNQAKEYPIIPEDSNTEMSKVDGLLKKALILYEETVEKRGKCLYRPPVKRKSPTLDAVRELVKSTLDHFLKIDFTIDSLNDTANRLCHEKEVDPLIVAKCVVRLVHDDVSDKVDLSNTPPAPPLTPNQQRLITLVLKLCSHQKYSELMEQILYGIEFRLLRLGFAPTILSACSLVRFFTALCRARNNVIRVQALIYDVLYCLTFKAFPLIFTILSAYPECLPRANSKQDSPIVRYIVHRIMTVQSPVNHGMEYKIKPLQRFLQQSYGYSNDVGRETLVSIFVSKLKAGDPNYLPVLILMAKHQNVEWAYGNLITSNLIPIIDGWNRGNIVDDGIIQAVLLIGYVLKSFPKNKESNISNTLNLLCCMLDCTATHTVKEAIAKSLVLLSKHQYMKLLRVLAIWQPSEEISEDLVRHTQLLMESHTVNWWHIFMRKSVRKMPSRNPYPFMRKKTQGVKEQRNSK